MQNRLKLVLLALVGPNPSFIL